MSSVHPFAPGIFSPFSLLQQKDREDGRTSFFFFFSSAPKGSHFPERKKLQKDSEAGVAAGSENRTLSTSVSVDGGCPAATSDLLSLQLLCEENDLTQYIR